MQTHRFTSPSNQLHTLCTVDGCKGMRTDAVHVVTEDIAVTVWQSPGIGHSFVCETRGGFINYALTLLASNTPFTVGHVFGNIDGTHPKR